MSLPPKRPFRHSKDRVAAWLLACLLLGCAATASAHETDQYSLPMGREFADLRFEISDYMRNVLQRGIDRLNARIRTSLDDESHPTSATARNYAPENVAAAVFSEFPIVVHMVEQFNLTVLDSALQRRYPGLVTGYFPTTWIYSNWLLMLDVTKLARLGRSATFQIDGVLLGTDKIVHFAHMGYMYHGAYISALKRGETEAQAVQAAIELGTGSNPIFSERTMLGELSTGVYSNADLISDYMGLRFYRNLTSEISLKGQMRPPLLTRDGPYWRLNDHVRGRTDFFVDFVSPHWNEAYNPSVYVSWMRGIVRDALERRCGDVLLWYTRLDGTPRTRDEFQAIHEDMRSYYGEQYGAEGDFAEMVTVANTCFSAPHTGQALGPQSTSRSASHPGLPESIRLGDAGAVSQALQAGADVNAADLDGLRPLHIAARIGQGDIVRLLLGRGANVNVTSANGLSPLHFAAREGRSDIVQMFVQAGARVGATDAFGRVPLHDAAERGDTSSASILLAAGAIINTTDGFGTTPLHLAARSGQSAMVDLLMRRGANASLVSQLGRTPTDEAVLAGHRGIAEFVRSASPAPGKNDLALRPRP